MRRTNVERSHLISDIRFLFCRLAAFLDLSVVAAFEWYHISVIPLHRSQFTPPINRASSQSINRCGNEESSLPLSNRNRGDGRPPKSAHFPGRLWAVWCQSSSPGPGVSRPTRGGMDDRSAADGRVGGGGRWPSEHCERATRPRAAVELTN
ncbi:unnamed protein product, partial [Iphiclides podalirius]